MQVLIFDETGSFHVKHLERMKDAGFTVKRIVSGVRRLVKYFEENNVSEQCTVIIGIGCEQTAMEAQREIKALKSLRMDIKLILCLGVLNSLEALFRLEPDDMLSVPVKEVSLMNALRQCREAFQEEHKAYVTLQRKGKINCLALLAIVSIESKGRCIEVNMSNHSRYTYYMTMGEIMELLPSGFLRCHQSFSVNTAYVNAYEAGYLVLQTGDEIPVSKRYRKIIREKFDLITQN